MTKKRITDEEIRRILIVNGSDGSEDEFENLLLDEDKLQDDQDIAFDTASDDEEDVIEVGSEEEDEQEGEQISGAFTEFSKDSFVYTSRDGTQWNSCLFGASRKHDVRGPLDKAKIPQGKIIGEPIDCFNLFFDTSIIHIIVNCTNLEGTRVFEAEWNQTDDIEIKSYFGLLLTAGTNKQSKVNILEFWDPLFGNPIFRASMSKNRFKDLQRCIRFDDRATRSKRKARDKLAPIRGVWEIFNKNLKKMYIPGENLTVDEQLVPFRGRVPFKQYIPSKPDKYGMKIWWICDNATSYPLQGLPYLDKEGARKCTNLPQHVVEKLCEPYFRTFRNVTFDNYFSSMQLAESLVANGITCVGTLRKDKKFIPKDFLPNKFRPVETNCFGFRKNMTLVSYVTKKNRAVIFLSTKHNTATVDKNKKNKSEVNLFYNKTKGGVDTLDQMAHCYTVRRQTNRWPLAFFHNIIDVGGIAAQVIWRKLKPSQKMPRKMFLRSVAKSLVIPQIQRRSLDTRGIHAVEQKDMLQLLQGEIEHKEEGGLDPPLKKRCNLCPNKLSRKSKQICQKCKVPVCTEH